jgi:hypothetical protein
MHNHPDLLSHHRTLQTAVGVFGGESCTSGVGSPLLMVENAGQSERLAISSLNCPAFLAVETCRERLVLYFPDECMYKTKRN